MRSYHQILRHILEYGKDRTDRTGTGTRSVFGYQFRHDLSTGFPLLTTKKVHFKSVLGELLWFLTGSTNVRDLQARGVTIWDEWADPITGDLGPVYGRQWRHWEVPMRLLGSEPLIVDQIACLVRDIRARPDSRRLIVSAWNPADVPRMALPPCHTLWQCQVDEGRLHLHLYARSIDAFLGLPFNIASYSLLLLILCHVTGLQPGDLIISFGDLHIYSNHFAQVQEQLGRELRPLPVVEIVAETRDIDSFQPEDFRLVGYNPHPTIKAPIAV